MSFDNVRLFPITADVNSEDHLVLGGCDTVRLASEFGTPLYVFDEETLPLRAIESIGVGVNNAYGITSVTTLDTLTSKIKKYYWNR